jgi:DNA polymerase-3 subunit delta'
MPFRDLIGHRRASLLLARAIARSRLPPSLLLTGPEGVGKRTLARAVAQALNCPTPSTGGDFEIDACGACTVCRRIARDAHPDVLTVTPGELGNIGVDAIREVVERTAYRPFEARKRVVIIDDAEAMVLFAQSALLKTLEEPPPSSVYVLVSALPDILLPTVRSRSARLRLGRLSAAEVAEVLVRASGMKPAEAARVAPLGEGSVVRALQMSAKDGARSRAAAQSVLESSGKARDARQRLALVKGLLPQSGSLTPAETRERLTGHLRLMAGLLRDLAVLNSRADRRMLTNTDLEGELAALTRSFDSARAVSAFTAVDRAMVALDQNANPKIVADWLVLQI